MMTKHQANLSYVQNKFFLNRSYEGRKITWVWTAKLNL